MPSTEEKVITLFQTLAKPEVSPQVTQSWLSNDEIRNKLQAEVEASNVDDGNPVVFARINHNKLRLCAYRWCSAELRSDSDTSNPATSIALASEDWFPVDWNKCRGAIVMVHGITVHSRFEFLKWSAIDVCDIDWNITSITPDLHDKLRQSIVSSTPLRHTFDKSWIQQLNRAGWVVYGIDLQSHGLSDGWDGCRCNVEKFDDFVKDVISWTEVLTQFETMQASTPLYLLGASLGGEIVLRTLQIGFEQGRFRQFQIDESTKGVPVKGMVLLAPALSAEQLKSKTINKILLPMADWISRVAPKLPVASIERNWRNPFIIEAVMRDPLVYTGRIPARLASESLKTMELLATAHDSLPASLRVVIFHSRTDTMVDSYGSQKFFEQSGCSDKQIQWVDEMWHFLTKEPGNTKILNDIIEWLL